MVRTLGCNHRCGMRIRVDLQFELTVTPDPDPTREKNSSGPRKITRFQILPNKIHIFFKE